CAAEALVVALVFAVALDRPLAAVAAAVGGVSGVPVGGRHDERLGRAPGGARGGGRVHDPAPVDPASLVGDGLERLGCLGAVAAIALRGVAAGARAVASLARDLPGGADLGPLVGAG